MNRNDRNSQSFTKEELSKRCMPVLSTYDFEINKPKYMSQVADRIMFDRKFEEDCKRRYELLCKFNENSLRDED